ncbi:hypothetical protein CYY_004690 [Polysphondylium violaceum]|uniref:NADH:flavin oxidoreductase/NADH oxidase N-terminal domain-containing protein n=1 Tax=Polysphondylium violaceum TaxID=133409 RepID=A0A8J4PT04_9MYCE|nr:hypothetical protein CYY_004690 [Polysphondylium violaceum]
MDSEPKIQEYHPELLFNLPKNYGSVGKPVKGVSNVSMLFSELRIKDLTLKNRIVCSPMCMYSCEDGLMNDFHLVHLGSFAKGGCGLIVFEATAVQSEGRITYADSGLWNDAQIGPLKRINDFVHKFDSKTCLQIAHAGRKASTYPPFLGMRNVTIPADDIKNRGWDIKGPSAVPWGEESLVPAEMSIDDIQETIEAFKATTLRAMEAGFDAIEIHGAHGYLISSFLSPTSNKRTDRYGGSFEGRAQFLVDIVRAVRSVLPSSVPLFVRLSCEEWVKDGIHIEDTVRLAKILETMDVDLLDCSSGGNSSNQKIAGGPLYQVPFAERIKSSTRFLTGAVGLINKPNEAEKILREDKCDLVFLARGLLRDPFWAIHAAYELEVEVDNCLQYSFVDKRYMQGLRSSIP